MGTGGTLDLHVAGGESDTGVFACNLIKLRWRRGLRIVGSFKSNPANVARDPDCEGDDGQTISAPLGGPSVAFHFASAGIALIVSPIGSADAFMKLATPCTILSLRAVTASFVLQ
jgi:hypothetical protein